jgi:hypothetical protein
MADERVMRVTSGGQKSLIGGVMTPSPQFV